jgi:hypothetical protein
VTLVGWILLGAGLVLASLSFVGERFFLGLPILRSARKAPWLRVTEFVCAYALFIGIGFFFEKQIGSWTTQGWAFYAVTFMLFIVAGFPAFAYRYLWDKRS